MFTIYHIPGVKIGCTSRDARKRAFEQGHTNFEILEQHTDIKLASKRELELQAEYGYEVEKYSFEQQYNAGKNGGTKNPGSHLTTEMRAKGSKTQMANGNHNMLRKATCPHCGKYGHELALKRWHFEKCKHKDLDQQ